VSRVRGVVLAVVSALYGAMWLFAATTKVLAPLPAYEFVGRVLPPGPFAKAVIVAAIAAEGALGTALLLRAVGAARGLVASSAGLALALGALLVVRSKADGLLPCGCYGDAFRSSIDDEIVVDAVMLALALALAAWDVMARRAAAPRNDA
jgi:hypothetical protein